MLFSLRGDAHKLYLRLKKTVNNEQAVKEITELTEVDEIQNLYKSLDRSTLKLIYYRMVKEKHGSGIIPIFVSFLPWFLFLFSSRLEKVLFADGSFLWLFFGLFYISAVIFSVIIHLREKAWATVHIEIIQWILTTREVKNNY